jgi:multidrug resistance efflux pump
MEQEKIEEKKNEETGAGENKARRIMVISLVVFVVVGTIVGFFYLNTISKRVYVEKSEIDATQISLSSQSGGVLSELFVNIGDEISQNTVVARLGSELVKSKDAGLVISRQDQIGKFFAPGEAIAVMIRPADLRVIGRVEEDKGFQDIKVGQKVIFEVDAFGTKQFEGVIDEVSQTSRPSDVVFNISDQRQENEFDVKARFNISQNPELKNGMSAKMWIYK